MRFPERFTVVHEPLIEGAKDSQGNPTERWGEPVVRRVITVYPPMPDDAIRDEMSGVDRHLDLLCYELWAGPRDRVTVDGEAFLVVGHPSNYTKHPWGFKGGYRVRLQRVEG